MYLPAGSAQYTIGPPPQQHNSHNGGLPLALDQAGAYLEETGCRLADYLALYQDPKNAGAGSVRTLQPPGLLKSVFGYGVDTNLRPLAEIDGFGLRLAARKEESESISSRPKMEIVS